MTLLPPSFRALVIGSSGTIGSAFVELLQADKACIEVVGIHRHSEYPIDYRHPETIEAAAKTLSLGGPFQFRTTHGSDENQRHWSSFNHSTLFNTLGPTA